MCAFACVCMILFYFPSALCVYVQSAGEGKGRYQAVGAWPLSAGCGWPPGARWPVNIHQDHACIPLMRERWVWTGAEMIRSMVDGEEA